jgi:hypothetical protein
MHKNANKKDIMSGGGKSGDKQPSAATLTTHSAEEISPNRTQKGPRPSELAALSLPVLLKKISVNEGAPQTVAPTKDAPASSANTPSQDGTASHSPGKRFTRSKLSVSKKLSLFKRFSSRKGILEVCS